MRRLRLFVIHSYADVVERMRSLLRLFDSRGLKVAGPEAVGDCLAGRGEGDAAVLTFDDGGEEWYPELADFFRDRGIKALAFVISRPEGRKVDWDFWTRNADVFEVGSHTVTHSQWMRSAGRWGAASLADEVRRSKKDVEAKTGVACRYFAYPWGRWTPELVAEVGVVGYEAAFSLGLTDGTRWTIPRTPNLHIAFPEKVWMIEGCEVAARVKRRAGRV